ncbi:MAG: 2-succinyl-5-enolpyruvyl-6-hydroxy-3-cyclohexene-1-carboxylic-acid synthase [Limnochordia bacterium]|nr:2-succinyl-5-enolpyruvyl-6-hydroxy-3-cyclohexene-1-carboxylic-acid synthase [Bacillota bacterium]
MNAYLPTIAFVDELVRAGLREVCFAPGSRSTPLALLFAQRPEVRLFRHIDERSAGFFGLGLAKALRRPVALLCTSGTAAANFLPAVVEAYFGRVPLIVLTADRPPEARGTGAPQTIDQLKLYGDHVKWFAEMPVPEARDELVYHARAFARRAWEGALGAPPGPVHLNFPFREPLLPPARPYDILAEWSRGRGLETGLIAQPDPVPPAQGAENAVSPGLGLGFPASPPPQRSGAPAAAAAGPLAALAQHAAPGRRGLIVCGPQDDPELGEAVTRLAARLGYPVLADPLSQVRCGPHSKELVIDAYDALLRDEAFAERAAPELVLHFGAPATSKPLALYLERHSCPRWVFDAGEGRDPSHRAQLIREDPVTACRRLEAALAARNPEGAGSPPSPSSWLALWQAAGRAAREACTAGAREAAPAGEGLLFEGRVFVELAELLPAGAALYAGNSMPVRDLDTFFPALDRPVRFFANRGANGIDGVVSSALGAAAGWEGPLVLVIGDLSFLHDLTGLLAAKTHGLSATVVLVHNDGGGIFSFLPQAGRPEHFEALFGTPTGLDFRPAAEALGAAFATARSWSHFRALVDESLRRPGVQVIEVRSERAANAALHRRIWQAVSDAVAPVLAGGGGEAPA